MDTMSDPETDSETLHDLPPSAKLVFKVLHHEGPLTQTQIADESLLSARTVRYALSRLKDLDIVDEELNLQDARKRLYLISDDAIQETSSDSDACCAD